jgi:hypothetical protein
MDSMAKDSGVKDRFYQHFHERIHRKCQEIKERQKAELGLTAEQKRRALRDELAKFRNDMPSGDGIFNPAFQIQGALHSRYLCLY